VLPARVYALDVTDPQAVARLRQQVLDEAGPLDVLVNNAGVVRVDNFLDVGLDDHLRTYRVNALAVVAMTHAFLPDLLARPRSHVVVVASAAAEIALPGAATYASSKSAALAFCESLRLELRRSRHRHVGVTAVCPAYVATEMFAGARPPLGTPVIDPDRLAGKVVRAIQRDVAVLRTPLAARAVPLLRGVLPRRLFDWCAERCGVYGSLDGWLRGAARRTGSD
jgi:short-subunit dehydrogenase